MPLTDYAVSGDKNKKIDVASSMTAPRQREQDDESEPGDLNDFDNLQQVTDGRHYFGRIDDRGDLTGATEE